MWPGVRVTEQNPFPFFPFDPRWREGFSKSDSQTFCALLRMAWISPRPCFLSADLASLNQTLAGMGVPPASSRVLAQFARHPRTGLLYFPSQLRALERLVSGEDLYALLWDEEL
jgi:hypothetical protein